MLLHFRSTVVVDYTAKVQIFEQITTDAGMKTTTTELLIIPQRYKFSSKSQLLSRNWTILVVVDYTAKVQIFEQITTTESDVLYVGLLLIIPQRYKFSSKSQRKK